MTGSFEKQSNRHCAVGNCFLTSMFACHMDSRWYRDTLGSTKHVEFLH